MPTYPLITATDEQWNAVWHVGTDAETPTPWNSANEVVSGDWDFSESDFLASVNYIIA